ncbi:CueP family metal-binding protein [Oceanobacillus kimchii]|uniref:CueP family metal-binding protein n=1 Tax=Oceanobacillus kimchii TaxID=746691 RepID=UPI0003456910|nr:CueP family metal-binding protein [Oceanobacillus kimchii]
MKIKLVLFISIAFLFVLVGCANNTESSTEDIKSMIQDYSTHQLTATSASVNATQLMVENDDTQENYELPEDEFFVSIAPYINETHPCTFHSLTGCQGELVNKPFDIYIEDMEGNLVFDDTVESFDNGFVDLWLPRDQEFKATITYEDKQAKSTISTFEDAPTCITTMQLM